MGRIPIMERASLSGAATLSTASLAVGTHPISASYGGDSKDSNSVSQAVGVVVSQSQVSIATTTTLSASATQVTTGQSVTFTASVSPQTGSNVAAGTAPGGCSVAKRCDAICVVRRAGAGRNSARPPGGVGTGHANRAGRSARPRTACGCKRAHRFGGRGLHFARTVCYGSQ